MTLPEMHVWFRQYAQQMGMQNVRAILPEQIDIVINTSISDTVNEIVKSHIAVTNDRVITDNSKIGQINALRTLYDTEDLTIGVGSSYIVTKTDTALNVYGKSEFIDFLTKKKNMLYLVDLSIQYIRGAASDNDRTYKYPVRIIDNMFLADTLQDFMLKPRFRSPIAAITKSNLELYLGDEVSGLTPNTLTVGMLKVPAKVEYREDIQAGTSVDCNLPEYLHVDILKHAVDLYNVAIQGNLHANQQQQQAQQRELGRNNVRPDNEGYAS